jgi:hypothetical protein
MVGLVHLAGMCLLWQQVHAMRVAQVCDMRHRGKLGSGQAVGGMKQQQQAGPITCELVAMDSSR